MTVHAERRVVAHAPRDLYELVGDVRSYPEFLPWCLGARIKERDEVHCVAELVIGYRMFRERFMSYVDLDPETLEIEVKYAEGPFRYLSNKWRFHPHDEGCEIEFHVDFEFNSRLLQSVIETFFTEAVKRMVRAFEQRADVLYGTKRQIAGKGVRARASTGAPKGGTAGTTGGRHVKPGGRS